MHLIIHQYGFAAAVCISACLNHKELQGSSSCYTIGDYFLFFNSWQYSSNPNYFTEVAPWLLMGRCRFMTLNCRIVFFLLAVCCLITLRMWFPFCLLCFIFWWTKKSTWERKLINYWIVFKVLSEVTFLFVWSMSSVHLPCVYILWNWFLIINTDWEKALYSSFLFFHMHLCLLIFILSIIYFFLLFASG